MAKSKEKESNSILEELAQVVEDGIANYDSIDSKIEYFCTTRSIIVDSVLSGGRKSNPPKMPFGRQVEIAGEPHSGKSTLCAHVAAEVQSQGGLVILTDVERRVDEPYWTSLGVDFSKVIWVKDTTLEGIFNRHYRILNKLNELKSDKPVLFITDSFGAASTENLFADETENADPMLVASKAMGKRAKIISSGMEIVNPLIAKNKVCYLYTNHLYSKLGVVFGDPYETGGGQKLKYMATVRLRLTRGKAITEKDEFGNEKEIGRYVHVRAVKNSMSPQLLNKQAVILGSEGFSNTYSIFEVAQQYHMIEKSGSWSRWITPSGEEVKFQGFIGFKEKVFSHKEYPQLVEQVIAALNG